MNQALSGINFDVPFRVVAIIAAHNEGDVIHHVVRDLIENGVEVYFIDNASTDDTVAQVAPFLGDGVLNIEQFPEESGCPSEAREKYYWSEILRRKEEVAASLGADWYLHADADEFRVGPWPSLSLAQALRVVDAHGYNAVNFDLYDFRPINDEFPHGADVRNYLRRYEAPRGFDLRQVKAWKNTGSRVDLASTAGHEVNFPDRRVFPISFILQHYPIRSSGQGNRKIHAERLNRFRGEERALGWHVQYDRFADGTHPFRWKVEELQAFALDTARRVAFERACSCMLMADELLGYPLTQSPTEPAHVGAAIQRRLKKTVTGTEIKQAEKVTAAILSRAVDAPAQLAALQPTERLLARIRFEMEMAHAHLTGNMAMAHACDAGLRYMAQVEGVVGTGGKPRKRGYRRVVVPPGGAAEAARRPRMNPDIALQNLVDISETLARSGVKVWLTDGTLLGLHREGGFIPTDQDTDLGIRIEDWSPALVPSLQDVGFSLAHVFGCFEAGLEYAVVRDGVKTDLFFFYQEGNRRWHGAWRDVGSGKRNLVKYYYDDFFPLAHRIWSGHNFFVPGNVERYIVTKYGEGWRTPVEKWDWAYSPRNHVKTDIVL